MPQKTASYLDVPRLCLDWSFSVIPVSLSYLLHLVSLSVFLYSHSQFVYTPSGALKALVCSV